MKTQLQWIEENGVHRASAFGFEYEIRNSPTGCPQCDFILRFEKGFYAEELGDKRSLLRLSQDHSDAVATAIEEALIKEDVKVKRALANVENRAYQQGLKDGATVQDYNDPQS